ncbi:16459_t:CDS:10 [Funneliformis geosporum]|uniref:3705_t:CDS:1 n=1 Tax=Funneliformis geosporum TaxID=1117311 RepID=A0A9W4WXB1_9GLOM|nr:16459_t:CDS:10 [Funneliformis geosporum]CAI2170467.1 3705_t:CDS:10 [Funneliformis geosporum]
MRAAPPKYAHSQVELKLSCNDLPDLDYLSKSDPQIILLIKDIRTQKWKSTNQQTEVVMNNLNPKFVISFILDYLFEELQQLRFICVDVDKPNNSDWQDQEFIGQFDCDLGSLVGCQGGKMKGKLYDPKHQGKDRGFIVISTEEVSKSKRNARLKFQANNIFSKSGLFKTKPEVFLIVSRANEDNTFSPVYKSIGISSASPMWDAFTIKEATLCNGDLDRPLQLQVRQEKKNGSYLILGQCTVTLNEILKGKRLYALRLPPGTNGKVGKDTNITVIHASTEEPPTFLDYIAGGTEINLVAAIDFTGSNGDPRTPKSLHYINGRRENDYQRAIRSVGKILEGYDYDRMFPVYGFGAKFNGVLSHTYPLNNNFSNPEVEGVDGIMAAYSQAIHSVELYGPTYFSPIINQTAERIKEEVAVGNDNVYYILLVITDGVITDMDSTIRSIVSASVLPLSIVIVGVGNADFTNMNILDADDRPLVQKSDYQTRRTEIVMDRDIVQFVAMRDFQTETAQYQLPKAVLEEIPDQFMSYMMKHNLQPRDPIRRRTIELEVDVRFVGSPDEPPPAYTS